MWPHRSLEPTTQPSRVPNGMRSARGSLAKQQRVSQCGAQWHKQARRNGSIQQLPTRRHHIFARVGRTQPPCARPHRSDALIPSSTVAPSTTLMPPVTRSKCTPRSFRMPRDNHTPATLAERRCDAAAGHCCRTLPRLRSRLTQQRAIAAARCRDCGRGSAPEARYQIAAVQ